MWNDSKKQLLYMLILVGSACAIIAICYYRTIEVEILGSERHSYLGKPSTYWEEQLHPKSDTALDQAQKLLTRGGIASMPVLVDILDNSVDGFSRARSAECIGQIGKGKSIDTTSLVRHIKDRDYRVRLAVIEALGNMGPDARSSIGLLREAAVDADPILRIAIALALLQIDYEFNRDSTEIISSYFCHQDIAIRISAIQALGKVGPAAKSVVPLLVDELNDNDPSIRMQAATSCWLVSGDSQLVLMVLIDLLKVPNVVVRENSARLLGTIGVDARPALEPLKSLLREENTNLRRAAQQAIESISASGD